MLLQLQLSRDPAGTWTTTTDEETLMFDLLTDELLDLTATQRGVRHAFFAKYSDCCCSTCCCCCDAG